MEAEKGPMQRLLCSEGSTSASTLILMNVGRGRPGRLQNDSESCQVGSYQVGTYPRILFAEGFYGKTQTYIAARDFLWNR